ncbi:MAG: hypothetical protein AABW50_00865 [Nanoarchaeota archaeon]
MANLDQSADKENSWRKNLDYFNENLAAIKSKYGRDTYVVIKDQKVVDSDSDKSNLARKYSDSRENILITSPKDHEKIMKFRSPRISR